MGALYLKGWLRSAMLAVVCVGLLPAAGWADMIVLRSGKRLITSKIKDTGTHYQFELRGLEATVAKSEVRHLVTTVNGKTVIVPATPKSPAPPKVKPTPKVSRPAPQKDPTRRPKPGPSPKSTPPPATKPSPVPRPPPTFKPAPVPKHTAPPALESDPKPEMPAPDVPLVGFRGLRWDLKLTDLANARHMSTDPDYGGVALYRNLDDSLRVGNLLLEEIVYGFWNEQFYTMTLWIGSYNGFKILRDTVFDTYGRGTQHDLSLERYVWRTPHTDVLLYYDVAIEKGILWFRNRRLHRRVETTNR